MRDPTRAVTELARDLSRLPDAAAYYATAPARLAELIPAEHVFWTRTDFVHETAEVRGECTPGHLSSSLGRHGLSHPAIQTYVADPADLAPRRVSDVTDRRTWHASALYAEVFAAYGAAHQLSMVCSVTLPGTGTGWTLTRSGRDFTEHDVDLAGRLLPVLLVLDAQFAEGGHDAAAGTSLSAREREVLASLAEGLTAASIGRRLGITERTVRKHLAALYDELGCHDRLLAVTRARERGLLRAAPALGQNAEPSGRTNR